jgi:hypothetical protein
VDSGLLILSISPYLNTLEHCIMNFNLHFQSRDFDFDFAHFVEADMIVGR